MTVDQSLFYSLGDGIADRRGHTGKIEDANAGQQLFPVKFAGIRHRNRTSGPVIDYVGGTDVGALFKVVDAKPRAPFKTREVSTP